MQQCFEKPFESAQSVQTLSDFSKIVVKDWFVQFLPTCIQINREYHLLKPQTTPYDLPTQRILVCKPHEIFYTTRIPWKHPEHVSMSIRETDRVYLNPVTVQVSTRNQSVRTERATYNVQTGFFGTQPPPPPNKRSEKQFSHKCGMNLRV